MYYTVRDNSGIQVFCCQVMPLPWRTCLGSVQARKCISNELAFARRANIWTMCSQINFSGTQDEVTKVHGLPSRRFSRRPTSPMDQTCQRLFRRPRLCQFRRQGPGRSGKKWFRVLAPLTKTWCSCGNHVLGQLTFSRAFARSSCVKETLLLAFSHEHVLHSTRKFRNRSVLRPRYAVVLPQLSGFCPGQKMKMKQHCVGKTFKKTLHLQFTL